MAEGERLGSGQLSRGGWGARAGQAQRQPAGEESRKGVDCTCSKQCGDACLVAQGCGGAPQFALVTWGKFCL